MAKKSNGGGSSKTFDQDEELRKLRAAQARKRGARGRGRHTETMTSGIIADRRRQIPLIAIGAKESLVADAASAQAKLAGATKDRVVELKRFISAALDAVVLTDQFADANPNLPIDVSIRRVQGRTPAIGRLARAALTEAAREAAKMAA